MLNTRDHRPSHRLIRPVVGFLHRHLAVVWPNRAGVNPRADLADLNRRERLLLRRHEALLAQAREGVNQFAFCALAGNEDLAVVTAFKRRHAEVEPQAVDLIAEKVARRHLILPIVVWNITRRCNLKCVHCYSDSEAREYPGELNWEQCVGVIDDLADYGVPALLLASERLGSVVETAMDAITAELPVGIDVTQIADQSRIVEHSFSEFVETFIEALAIVLLVSFLSLGWRVGVVVALSVPLVLAIVLTIMHAVGIDLHRITLGALIIALGLLVDDAIIAIEMMVVKLEEGWDRVRAASHAWTVTATPMLYGTLVTAAGFDVAHQRSSGFKLERGAGRQLRLVLHFVIRP